MRRVSLMAAVPVVAGAVLAVLGLVAGCASPAPVGAPSAPSSAAVPPAASPSSLPSSPPSSAAPPSRSPSPFPSMSASDQLPGNVVVGTVTADSGGPCYLVVTDDGVQYALIGSGGSVRRGQRVRALTEQRPSAVDCGPGLPLGLVKLEISG